MTNRKRTTNPIADAALGALEAQGTKMLRNLALGGIPAVVDGVLADIEGVAEEVTKRTKTARGKIAARRKR
jgi:hypothetical protein